jgi:hypothetical protein
MGRRQRVDKTPVIHRVSYSMTTDTDSIYAFPRREKTASFAVQTGTVSDSRPYPPDSPFPWMARRYRLHQALPGFPAAAHRRDI